MVLSKHANKLKKRQCFRHSDYIYSSGTLSALMYWVQFWGQFFGIQWKNDKSPRVRVSFVLGTSCAVVRSHDHYTT